MKHFSMISMVMITAVLFIGCSQNTAEFSKDNNITVVSREDGSGTRGAFIELFGIEVKGEDGTKKDMTTKESVIANKTDVMMTNIENDPYAIGYVSLGSLNSTIKALDIDGVNPTPDNVKNKTYKISRPFNIATKGEPSGLVKDFIDFILSKDGQNVVSKNYISINDNAPDYIKSNLSGKITIAGSSSVTPIMEKLKEAYNLLNKDVDIEIQMSDSTSGMTGVIEGTCNIGMASRELKDTEKAQLFSTPIALDGIAVIVHTKNVLSTITTDQVRAIFTGKIEKWNDVH